MIVFSAHRGSFIYGNGIAFYGLYLIKYFRTEFIVYAAALS